MDFICVSQALGTFYRPVCVRVRLLWGRTCYGLGWNLSWWSHSAQNCSRNIECRKIQRRYSWSYRSMLTATAKLWSCLSSWQSKMSRGWYFVKNFWTRITPVFFPGRHYHRICHQLNSYLMNSVDVFAAVKMHRKHYRSCVMHLCTSRTTFNKPLSNGWLVLCVGDAKLSLLQEVVTHVTELHKLPYCMTISVCPWFVLIIMLRNFVDIALFVMPMRIEIIRFLSISLFYV